MIVFPNFRAVCHCTYVGKLARNELLARNQLFKLREIEAIVALIPAVCVLWVCPAF